MGNINDNNLLYVHLKLDLVEKNEDSYLSAGEMPLPTLYLTWALIYFLGGVSWIYIIKTTKFVFLYICYYFQM
jgi:hypothetical protein